MAGLSLSAVLRTFFVGVGALQLPVPVSSSRRAVIGGLAAAVLAPRSAHSATGGVELPDALEDLPKNAKKARTDSARALRLAFHPVCKRTHCSARLKADGGSRGLVCASAACKHARRASM